MSKYKLFKYCPKKKKVVPIEQVESEYSSKAINNYIQDEMPPTRNPLNPKEIYTSKSKLRAAYKAAGAIEVGDAYERGYDPGKERRGSEERMVKQFMQRLKERVNG